MIAYCKKILAETLSLLKGMFITSKNMLTPAVTLRYPDQKETMNERFRGLVDLYPEKCIACYQCVRICPTGCLSLKHKLTEQKKKPDTFTYNIEWCCFCGLCEQVCPTDAIYLNQIYEIAVYDHSQLLINLMDPEKYREWNSASNQ